MNFEPSDSTPKNPEPGDPELRTCSVLFCDIAQSTRYASVLGEVDYARLLAAYQQVGKDVIERYKESCTKDCEYDIRGDQLCFMAYGSGPKEEANDAARVVALARDLKITWLFSSYNREQRVKINRAPVSIMIGIHTGKVALGAFPRADNLGQAQDDNKQPLRISAEGFAISIGKRVEASARHGNSWQIMLTDGTLSRMRRPVTLEIVRSTHAILTEGLTYPVSEIVDLEMELIPNLARCSLDITDPSNAQQVHDHLEAAVQLDPTPWHCLLWAYWNLYYRETVNSKPDEDWLAYEQALLTNPHSAHFVEQLAQRHFRNKDPDQALIMIDLAEKRLAEQSRAEQSTRSRYAVLRAMAHLMLMLRTEGPKDSAKTVESYCVTALYSPQWRSAAKIILRILEVERPGQITDAMRELCKIDEEESREVALNLIHSGLDLAAITTVDAEALTRWKGKIVENGISIWFNKMFKLGIMELVPLFGFCSERHDRTKTTHRREIYDFLIAPKP